MRIIVSTYLRAGVLVSGRDEGKRAVRWNALTRPCREGGEL